MKSARVVGFWFGLWDGEGLRWRVARHEWRRYDGREMAKEIEAGETTATTTATSRATAREPTCEMRHVGHPAGFGGLLQDNGNGERRLLFEVEAG